jgi:hypothetical protein
MLHGKNILGLKQISTGAILPSRTADNGRSAVLPKPAMSTLSGGVEQGATGNTKTSSKAGP